MYFTAPVWGGMDDDNDTKMLASIIFRGFIVGLLASMPPGPVAVLCIQRTISKNQRSGFVSGIGAAAADTVYAMIAFFSLALVVEFIETNRITITIIAGLIVMGLGVKVMLSNPVIQIRRNRAGKTNLWQDFLTVFFVTIANPVYILLFITFFAAFGLSSSAVTLPQSALVIAGVFLGCATWWFTLSILVNLFRKRFRPRHLLWINRISGLIIIAFGFFIILTAFFNFPLNKMLH